MIASEPPLPISSATLTRPASPSLNAPSLQLPWMQALIHSGARLSRPEESAEDVVGNAGNAVHYIRCGYGPGTVESGTDFLTAVAKARKLVATGAKRIVFLTFGDTPDGRLHQSLISFSRHASRALTAHPAEFAVVPIEHAAIPFRKA
ncbi:MAG: hypothetical protein ACK4VZ_03895 [Paracoccaceae bacterium]